jgi:hypothetical protein
MTKRWQSYCPGCGGFLKSEPTTSCNYPCPHCSKELRYTLFPAARGQPSTAGNLGAVEGEAVCFHHDDKRATQECSGCGKFLCALCAVRLSGRFVCPECLRLGVHRREDPLMVKERFIPSDAATIVLLFSVVFFAAAALIAPFAIGLALWSLKHPGSLVRKTRRQAWSIIILGLCVSILSVVLWFRL